MKTKLFFLILILSSLNIFCSNPDTIFSNSHVNATYYDSVDNILYAGGKGYPHNLLKFQNDSCSYFEPAVPFGEFFSIQKFNNNLYVAGAFGVAKFDGVGWILLSTAYLKNRVKELFVFDNKLFAFTDYLEEKLTFWDGADWNQIDPEVSGIGCQGISTMFLYNNDLYANSSENGGGAVLIKKSGNQWTFPGGNHFNINLVSHCVLNNNLYLSDDQRVYEYNGENFRWLNFWAAGGSYSTFYKIHTITSDGRKLFISGDFDQIYNVSGNMVVNNLISWCGESLISSIQPSFSNYINHISFYNNKLYAYGYSNNQQAPFSVIDSLNDYPNPIISIIDTSFCQGETISISEISNTGIKWLWEVDDYNPATYSTQKITLNLFKPGFHTVKITVSNCTGDSTKVFFSNINVLEKPPIPTIKIIGDTLFSSSLINNQWLYNGAPLSDTSDYILVELTKSTYIQVQVKNEFGCTSSSGYVTALKETDMPEAFNVFPNPNNGLVTLKRINGIFEKYTLLVETIQGKRMLTETIDFKDTYTIDLRSLPDGIYFLILQNNRKRMVQKIVVQR